MIAFIFLLIILGCALYLIETYVPMAAPIRIVIRVVVILVLVWYLLALFHLAPMPPR